MPLLKRLIRKFNDTGRNVYDFGLGYVTRRGPRSASGYQVLTSRFGQFYYRAGDSDLEALRQIYVRQCYDLDRFPQGGYVRTAYEQMLARNITPVIIDAGANAGYSARFLAQSYPLARVVAVEPDAANARICRANTSTSSRIEVVEAAIGAEGGHVSLVREEGRGSSWAVKTRRADTGVPVVTIPEILSGIDNGALLVVKVDIEGFEADLFSTNLGWLDKTVALIVEPHDWLLPGRGTSRPLQRAMLDRGFEVLISGDNLVFVAGSASSRRGSLVDEDAAVDTPVIPVQQPLRPAGVT